MTAALTPALQIRDDNDPALDLASDPAPLVIVDPNLAEIVAANAAGSRAIGLFPYASFPIALDASTPALARLREIAALGTVNGKSVERLVFWSNGRLNPVRCIVRRQGTDRAGVFVLRILDENGSRAQPVAVAQSGDAKARTTTETQAPDKAAAPGSQQTAPSKILDPDHLAKLAHELKTPLTAIAAAAEIMRDERLGAMGNARYLNYAADIRENAMHALDVITTLLSESASSATPLPRLIALDLNAVVERTASSIQALAQSRNLALVFEAEKTRPHVIANPTSLRQILLNLLTNAIKFTPAGGDVVVETGNLADGRVFLSVRNTSCGIADDIAEPSGIARPNEAAQSWLRGSGIGLPLVQRLVREMGAEFEIDSTPEKGTVALITFGGFARWPA